MGVVDASNRECYIIQLQISQCDDDFATITQNNGYNQSCKQCFGAGETNCVKFWNKGKDLC